MPTIALLDHESACASVTSLFSNSWLKGYARGKLRIDPMYSVVFECLRGSRLPILDFGCGIGILLYYLGYRALHLRMFGLDWDAGRIAVAQQIAQAGYQNQASSIRTRENRSSCRATWSCSTSFTTSTMAISADCWKRSPHVSRQAAARLSANARAIPATVLN